MAKKRKDAAAPSRTESEPQKPLVEISEQEQWRIIHDSGILGNIPTGEKAKDEDKPLLSPFTEECFAALALIVPFSFLLLMMEILVHYQYGRNPTSKAIADRMIPGVPIIVISIFYTNRYKHDRRMQAAFFLLACVTGTRLIYMINWANWRDNMSMLPPLATAWIYGVAQLNLGPSVASLAVVGGITWYKNWQLKFF